MPLIVMSGTPCSGKTSIVNKIKQYFEEQGKEVHIVSEEEQIKKAGFSKNVLYKESAKEKHIRSILKSEVLRLINSKDLVILDGLNYIKGYRYELFCVSKANKCTQCTVQTAIERSIAWDRNLSRLPESERYSLQIFDELIQRYEEPDSRNRWDSPLFVVVAEHGLDLKAMFNCLYNKVPPPPNRSTQNAPLSSTNFLYELDKVTKAITDHILKAKSMGTNGEIEIAEYNLTIDISNVNASKLLLLRRQYITYSKMHVPNVENIPQLYIQYLKASLGN